MTNEQIIATLVAKGVTCRSCWWQEGGRCYVKPCIREEPVPGEIGQRSVRLADAVCQEHTSKRSVLESVFPADRLIIASEKGDPNKTY